MDIPLASITISEQTAVLSITAVVSGLGTAIGVLWRAKETNDKSWREDSERLFTLVAKSNETLNRFASILEKQTATIYRLSEEVSNCPRGES